MVGINGWEFVILIVLALVLIGPERMPEYAAKLARFVHQARQMAEGARGQLREQMGPEFDEIDWKQYDPRQYDPRRIVKDALAAPLNAPEDTTYDESWTEPVTAERDPGRPTPYDVDAT